MPNNQNSSYKHFISPEFAVRVAWGRTVLLSSNEKASKLKSEDLKKQIDLILKSLKAEEFEVHKRAIEKNLDELLNSPETKDQTKTRDEIDSQLESLIEKAVENLEVNRTDLKYVNGVKAAIEATFRNLVIARNGLDMHWKQASIMRDNRYADYENFKTWTKSLGSVVPRIAGMAAGGAGTGTVAAVLGPAIANAFNVVLPVGLHAYSLALAIVIGNVAGYAVYGGFIVPRFAGRKERDLVEADYERDMYILNYRDDVKTALENLYTEVNKLHKEIFDSFHFDPNEETKFVENLLKSIDLDMCKCVHYCKKNKKLKLDRWATCETGIKCKECDEYPEASARIEELEKKMPLNNSARVKS